MTRRLHVFVIDDSVPDLLLAEEVFATFNDKVTVTTYQSGQAALNAMWLSDAVYPDIVLLDINMPKMNGFEVLKAMKTDARLKSIPVVMLTTSLAAQDVTQAYSLFANSYVVKSVDFSQFLRQIESLVEFWTRSRLLNWPTPLSMESTSSIRLKD
ncbi:response regulator [Deinococcus sp. QL22]|uniref:response regulator n=1 Tax=Deinococcus sp. QL22 TaxID=2939437 RepID=UPI0020171F12|nr:response regulator [Deinococcus sp. QL22]UQN10127.1 response regulator [Deinococcus sp. QL22]